MAGFFLFWLARAIEARITWYLAVDQFGYLQFAHDLLNGTVFHDWEPARIMGILPKRTDVLAQTYIYDDGRMYCRYSPGFPMLVAGWLRALRRRARLVPEPHHLSHVPLRRDGVRSGASPARRGAASSSPC